MRKSRMFEGLRTWNPWFGCLHHCYRDGCWVKRKLAHRLGSMLNCLQCYYFDPHDHFERLRRIPNAHRLFVVAHGDLFGRWVHEVVIEEILKVCRNTEKELWFFETKNPRRYFKWEGKFPKNTVLSTTIETNRVYPEEIRGITPTPAERFQAMLHIADNTNYPIHISIEPIMDFDFDTLLSWMKQLRPSKVAVGYDSLNNDLPEPPKEKTSELIGELEKFTDVERKQL